MKKNSYNTSVLLLVGILLVVAVISENYFFRLDLTKGKIYSLSNATKGILKNLKEPVTVTAYFTKNLPPDLAKVKQNFKDMLIEYNSLSKGKVVYKFENPSKNQKTEAEAMRAGIQPVLFNVRQKDEMKQQKVFMGAKIQKGDNYEVIPFVNPKGSIEYDLSTAIKKLSVKNKPLIGFVEGQGETPIKYFQQVMKELKVLYNVKPLRLNDSIKNLYDYKTLIINAPKDSFNLQQMKIMDDYLHQGGNIYIAMNRVEGNLRRLTGNAVNTGLETWLSKKGLQVVNGFIVDESCGNIGVSQRTGGGFSMTTQIKFPYLPIITHFADHPITKGLEEVVMKFSSPMHYTGDSSYTFTPLAFSSKHAGVEKSPVYFNINKHWGPNDFKDKNLIVAGLLVGKNKGRIIVITNGDFAINGSSRTARRLQPDNVNLMVNSIDWLSDDTGLINLRTKSITSRPIKQLSDSTKLFLKWLNFLLPILLVIIYGLIRMQYRTNQRIKRMEEGYVK